MSKRICGRCGSTDIEENSLRGKVIWCNCNRCKYFAKVADFPEQSVFHQITASPEVLAEDLVYEIGAMWMSTLITDTTFDTYEEAIAATVAKLKEAIE